MEVKYGIRLYKVEIYYQMFFIHFTILGRTLERLADTWQTLHGRCGSVSAQWLALDADRAVLPAKPLAIAETASEVDQSDYLDPTAT